MIVFSCSSIENKIKGIRILHMEPLLAESLHRLPWVRLVLLVSGGELSSSAPVTNLQAPLVSQESKLILT